MLRAWGATCGQCRGPLGHARRNDRIQAARQGLPSLTLGWLVVAASPDELREGQVLPVDYPITVITREGAVAGLPGEIALRDDFLSAGHALIKRAYEGAGGGDGAFTLEDRRDPGPSANGTFLNSRRLAAVEAAPLCDGDEIRVGSSELVFRTLFVPGSS
jgi:pSer/pThr/pTyr-binding forkhead associated (FHA) protein